jgi:hypothetical protein
VRFKVYNYLGYDYVQSGMCLTFWNIIFPYYKLETLYSSKILEIITKVHGVITQKATYKSSLV